MPSDLREALTAAGASALIPKIIDPMLLEYQRRYSPLVRSIPAVKWGSDTYYYNQRTVNPNGGFVTDGGARPVTNSTYVQNSFQMRHFQGVGAVTGYAENVTQQVIQSLRAKEIQGTIQGQYWDIEHAMVWGNAGSTAFGAYPQFDGFDSLANTYTGAGQNALDFAGGAMTLAALDQLIDMVESNAAMGIFDSTWQLVMSPTMASKVAQILQAQQRFNDRVEVAAGLLVPTYRDIPIVKTSFLASRSMQVGAVTTTPSGSNGTLAAGVYNYRVSAVISRQGEIAASSSVASGTLTGSTSSVTLNLPNTSGVDGLAPVLWKVYRTAVGGSAGTETLLGVVDATVGLGTDGVSPIPTTSIIDTGTALIPQNVSTQPASTPTTYQGGNANKFAPLLSGGTSNGVTAAAGNTEDIYLMARDDNFLCRPYVRELQAVDIYPTTNSPDSLPFALVSDCVLALRAPKYMGALRRVGSQLHA